MPRYRKRPSTGAGENPAFMRDLRAKLAAERESLDRNDLEVRQRALALDDRIADLDRELARSRLRGF
jgi:hypothetical protein